MNRLSVISHVTLKYLLIIPLIISVFLGIFVAGGVKYQIACVKEAAALEVKLQYLSLKQLSE